MRKPTGRARDYYLQCGVSMERREFITVLGCATGAWPFLAHAQQSIPVIGYLSTGSPESDNTPSRLIAFREGLDETGFVEGQNVAIEYRWAEGRYDRLPALAADLTVRRVKVLATGGAPPTLAAKAATVTIPIVFVQGIDPVQFGIVASLNHPGGNITGAVNLGVELTAKRLQLLHELLPKASVFALLVNPANAAGEPAARKLQDAALSLGLQVHTLRASTASEIDTAFRTFVKLGARGLLVYGDPFFTNQRAQIVALAARHAVPAIYEWRLFPTAGGLMSYGSDLADSYRLAGVYTGKILKGANPADLPVQQVVKVELVINIRTAKALGLTIPLALLGRVDEVIE